MLSDIVRKSTSVYACGVLEIHCKSVENPNIHSKCEMSIQRAEDSFRSVKEAEAHGAVKLRVNGNDILSDDPFSVSVEFGSHIARAFRLSGRRLVACPCYHHLNSRNLSVPG